MTEKSILAMCVGSAIWELELEPVIDVENEITPFISLSDVSKDMAAPTEEDNHFQFSERETREMNKEILRHAGEGLKFDIGELMIEV